VTRPGTSIRAASSDDYPAIAGLLDRVLGKKPYEQRLMLWRWRFDGNPARTDAFGPFLVAEERGRIVGVQGLIPLRLKAGPRELAISCSCDLAVEPAARSAGMKLKLAAMAKELSPLHLSTSANEVANRITLALGGREVTTGRTNFLLPLKASGLMARKLEKRGARRGIVAAAGTAFLKPIDWILAIGRSWKTGGARRDREGVFGDISRFDDRFDRFWGRLAEEHELIEVRDASYLDWRYTRYPFPGIQSFEMSCGGELRGFLVLHVALDEDGLRFAAVQELAAAKGDEEAIRQLTAEAIRRAANAGAHYLIARAPHQGCEKPLLDLGFSRRHMSYSPVTYKDNSDAIDKVVSPGGNWYLSLGDGDGGHYFPEAGPA